MNRRNAYLIIATSWTLICPSAIAQDNASKAAVPSNKSVATGTTSLIPIAPRMVLPKTKITAPLRHSVQKKARGAYPSSHFQKAMYFKQKNDKAHALVEFLKSTQENPRLVKAYYEQALIFRERNFLKLAQSSLDQALAIKPDYQEARMLLATIQIQQGNVGAAMKQLGQSLGINVGTGDGATKSDDDLPQPMVLQSVHMALPESMAQHVMRVVKANPTDDSNVAQDVANERESLKHSSRKSKRKNARTSSQADASQNDAVASEASTAKAETGAMGPTDAVGPENKAINSQTGVAGSADNEIAFGGIKFPNPLHMFWNSKPEATPELPVSKITVAKKSNLSNSDFVYVRNGEKASGQTNEIAETKPSAIQENETPVGKPPISGDFSDEAAANLDVNKLPTLPVEENKADSPESKTGKEPHAERSVRNSEKPSKKSKKSWLARFIPSFEEDQNVTPAPPPTSPLDRAVATAISAGGSAMKQGMATELPVVPVETFDKPDESRALVEKVTTAAQAAATNISNIAKNGFQLPNLPNINSNLFGGFGTSGGVSPGDANQQSSSETPKPYKPQIAPNSDDPWSVRLRYLADHGTGTLKEGEAFMFSEESGEATLFLADGQTVRRTIYLPRDAQEVVKQRRPDIVNPDDLLYNLSLLAKLMPRASQQQASSNPPIQTIIGAPAQQAQQPQPSTSNFDAKDLMGKSQKFWGWLKGRFENMVPN